MSAAAEAPKPHIRHAERHASDIAPARATIAAAARAAKPTKPSTPQRVPGFLNFGHITLRGVSNARDLGGLPTSDGRRIKKRRLVRSSELSDATASDMKQLTRMHGVDCVIDFRTNQEVKGAPDPLPLMDGIKYLHVPVFTKEAVGITSGGNAVKDARVAFEYASNPFEMIQEMYPKCVLGEPGIAAYKAFLNDLITEESGATLWHCTQGKDRTGIAALLVEYALGVPMEYIRADYLATNLFVRGWAEKVKALFTGKPFGRKLDDVAIAYGYANMCYLDAALSAICNSFGSINKYMDNALDFDVEKRAYLRELYLE